MTTLSVTTNAAGLAAVPDLIEAFVPSLDLSALDAITGKVKTATGQIKLTLDLGAKGPLELDLNLIEPPTIKP